MHSQKSWKARVGLLLVFSLMLAPFIALAAPDPSVRSVEMARPKMARANRVGRRASAANRVVPGEVIVKFKKNRVNLGDAAGLVATDNFAARKNLKMQEKANGRL